MSKQNFKFSVGEEVHIGRFNGVILRCFRNNEGRKSYQYKCLKCGYDQGEKTEISIIKGFGCPCCANRIVIPGINDIPTAVLKKLALFYNTSVDYLLDLTDEPKPYPRKK